jgi:cellulose synthase (UDP-forming)
LQEYVTQRGRWCLGLMQIVCGPMGPLARNRLPLADRIGLIDSFLFWSVTFAFRFACLLAPILYWFFGICLVDTGLPEVLSQFLPYIIAVFAAFRWATRGTILPLLTDVSQIMTMFEINQAVVTGLLKPNDRTFKVTAKGCRRDRVTVQWRMLGRFGVLTALTVIGMIYGMASDYGPGQAAGDGRIIVLFWSYYNLVVLGLAMAVCIELPRYRRDERFATDESVGIEIPGGLWRTRLIDLSSGGARLLGRAGLANGDMLTLHIDGVGPAAARLVYQGDDGFTVRFAADAALRDRLVRKLHSSRYGTGVDRISVWAILRGVGLRFVR